MESLVYESSSILPVSILYFGRMMIAKPQVATLKGKDQRCMTESSPQDFLMTVMVNLARCSGMTLLIRRNLRVLLFVVLALQLVH